MHQKGSFRHYLQYVKRDGANKIFAAFTLFCFAIVIPSLYLVDRSNYPKEKIWWFTQGSWKETAFFIIYLVGGLFTIITAYTIVKYRKYINNGK